ncbi:MAG: DNA repair protein RadA, partial [Treponema sp.]|nr:DNA repair protein RadA [Treponema sp.]
INEFDRVLGGGAVLSSAILIGGEPGIGKSTLLMQSCFHLSESRSASESRGASAGVKNSSCKKNDAYVLYVSGEESASQIKERALRLKIDESAISLLCTMRLEDILDALDEKNPKVVIVDSIQTVYSAGAGLIPGTVNQLKYCANELIQWVKEHEAVLIMSAHVTKEGVIAGPKSLEHMVDTVISFEHASDEYRFLRAMKNRFGSVDEIGIFEMTEDGLQEVGDPSNLFITRREGELPSGVSYCAVFEGSRVFMVELQALTVPAKGSLSRVYSDKIESGRVARIAAVLEKKLGLQFSNQDIYVNVAGGIRLTESAIDAALASALYSARTDLPIAKKTAVIGEVSLAGEIREVRKLSKRIKTAQAMGFSEVVSPESVEGARKVLNVKDLVSILFN